jgi:AhpD family alkylhydroperoxidase
MQARMNNPATVVPGAMQALLTLGECVNKGGVPPQTLHLVHLRSSQINGCSVCVDMHSRELQQACETDKRIFTVAA